MANASGTPKFAGMKYRVINTLGTGAGSTILLISDKTSGGKRYALKVVRKQEPEDEVYVQQAKTEFEAAKKLNHPAIAKVFDCRTKKAWFKVTGVELLLEYVDGKTLDEIEAPELGQIVLIFCQVSSALTHMHRRGVYHGDLKPSNIMLTKTGQVKLIDFGTAWVRGQEKNRIQGTPNFIAPEQATEKVVDEKTDIYNLERQRCIRMFTGRYAQQGILKNRAKTASCFLPIKVNPRGFPSCSQRAHHRQPEHRPVEAALRHVRDAGSVECDCQADGSGRGRLERRGRRRLTRSGRPTIHTVVASTSNPCWKRRGLVCAGRYGSLVRTHWTG